MSDERCLEQYLFFCEMLDDEENGELTESEKKFFERIAKSSMKSE